MDQERLNAWRDIVPIARDLTIIGLAIFVTVFGVIHITDPTLLGIVLGFAVTLLGGPLALRLDAARRKVQNGNGGNGNGHGDRWSGLP